MINSVESSCQASVTEAGLEKEPSLTVCTSNELCMSMLLRSSPEARRKMMLMVPDEPAEKLRLDDMLITKNLSSGQIWEWYGSGGDSKNEGQVLGSWSSQDGVFSPHSNLSKWERRTNLNGLTMRITAEQWDPISIRTLEEDGTTGWTGMIIEVVEELKHALNFTITYISPADGLWGGKVGQRARSCPLNNHYICQKVKSHQN